ncbi:MAG: fibronectin type III domain-containing protein [Clostridia bacterium]|nr:fibronectin type III domain-containing protein [Clostridia bacterium]
MKKWISLILTAVMLCSSLPVSSFAEAQETEEAQEIRDEAAEKEKAVKEAAEREAAEKAAKEAAEREAAEKAAKEAAEREAAEKAAKEAAEREAAEKATKEAAEREAAEKAAKEAAEREAAEKAAKEAAEREAAEKAAKEAAEREAAEKAAKEAAEHETAEKAAKEAAEQEAAEKAAKKAEEQEAAEKAAKEAEEQEAAEKAAKEAAEQAAKEAAEKAAQDTAEQDDGQQENESTQTSEEVANTVTPASEPVKEPEETAKSAEEDATAPVDEEGEVPADTDTEQAAEAEDLEEENATPRNGETLQEEGALEAADLALKADTTETGEITGLQFVEGTATTLTIGWNRITPNTAIKGYKVSWTPAGGATKTATVTGADTGYDSGKKLILYTITGLETGKKYTYKVCVIYNSGTTSDWVSGSRTVLADPPQNLTAGAVSVSAKQVKLTWDAPSGGTVKGYFIYRDGKQIGDVTASTLSFIDNGSVLKPGDTHSYAVYAYSYNSSGNKVKSQRSSVIKYTIKPGTTASMEAKPLSTTTMKITWKEVEGASGYTLAWGLSSNDGFSDSVAINDPKKLSYKVSGLAPLLKYKFRLQAFVTGGTVYNSDGSTKTAGTVTGSWHEPIEEITRPGNVPGVAANYDQSTGNITVSWKAIEDTVSNYKVYRSNKADSGFTVLDTVGSNVLKYVDENVNVGETWYYKVVAVYSSTESLLKNATVVWALVTPAAPQNLKADNGSFKVSSGKGSAVLTWKKSAGADGYVIQYAEDAAFTKKLSKKVISGGSKESATVWGLTMGTTYYFRVCGYVGTENTGRGKFSNVVSLQGAPGNPDPASLVLEARNPRSVACGIKATWAPVEGAEGYWVAVSNVTTGAIIKKDTIAGQSNTSYVFDGLTAGERYRVTVRSYRGSGFSIGTRKQDNFKWASGTLNAMPVLAPSKINVTAVNGSSVKLSWPKVYGVSGYWLRVSSTDDGNFTSIDTNLKTSRKYTLSGLKPGYTYKAEVYTYSNAQGTIFYSTDFGTDKLHLTSGTAMVAPQTPTGLKATLTFSGSIPTIQLSWNKVSGLDSFNGGYFLLRNPGWGSSTTNETVRRGSGSNGFTDTLTAADIGKSYAYRVGSYLDPLHSNNEGAKLTGKESKSSYSDRIVVVVRNATPVVSVTNDASGRIVLNWQKIPTADRYAVYRATTNDIGKCGLIEGIVTGTSYTDISASTTPGTTYYYWVKAITNAARTGDSLYSKSVKGTVALSTSGWGWNYVVAYAKSVDLSWKALKNAQSYNIYRIKDDGAPTKIANVKGTTYKDTNIVFKSKYEYSIRAVYGGSESAYMKGAGRNGRWSAARYAELTKLKNLKATPLSMTEAKLTWDTVRDATGYRIVLTHEDGSKKTIDVTEKSYKITAIKTGERIKAEVYPTFTTGGKTYPIVTSEINAVHSVIEVDLMVYAAPKATTSLKATNITTNSVNVVWSPVEPTSTTRFAIIYRKSSESTWKNGIAAGALTQDTFCNIPGLASKTEYVIRVLSTYVDPNSNKQYDGGYKEITVTTK